jgi:hypothetical protein
MAIAKNQPIEKEGVTIYHVVEIQEGTNDAKMKG